MSFVLERDEYACQLRYPKICTGEATTGDHVIPLAAGGAELDAGNVVAACAPCNWHKGNRPAPETDADAHSRDWSR